MKLVSPKRIIYNRQVPICSQTCYAPSYIQDPNPVLRGAYEAMITQGDPIDRPSFPPYDPHYPMSDPNRGADRLRLWIRRPAQEWRPYKLESWPYQDTNVVIGNHFPVFPWMGDEDYLTSHPEVFVGSTASPSVYKDETTKRYVCWFTGTAGDPYATTARQFTLFCATSPDLVHWTGTNFGNDHPNRAIRDRAALWFGEFIPATKYPGEQGITTVSALPTAEYTFLVIQVWTVNGSKNGVVRQSASGFEIWRGGDEWEKIRDGQLPDWYTTGTWSAGNPFPWIIEQVLETPRRLRVGRGRYMLTSSPDQKSLWVSFSDNLTDWHGDAQVELEKGVSSIRYPRLVSNGDMWIFSSNYESGCDSAYRGQVIYEARCDY